MNTVLPDMFSNLHKEFRFIPGLKQILQKKYYLNANYFMGIRSLFNSPNHEMRLSQRYRFNDKFSVSATNIFNTTKNDAGFYRNYYETDGNGNLVLRDIIFPGGTEQQSRMFY